MIVKIFTSTFSQQFSRRLAIQKCLPSMAKNDCWPLFRYGVFVHFTIHFTIFLGLRHEDHSAPPGNRKGIVQAPVSVPSRDCRLRQLASLCWHGLAYCWLILTGWLSQQARNPRPQPLRTATAWVLTIPLVQGSTEVLRIDELNDIEIYFHHYSAQRQ